jgi:hypothetical protein
MRRAGFIVGVVIAAFAVGRAQHQSTAAPALTAMDYIQIPPARCNWQGVPLSHRYRGARQASTLFLGGHYEDSYVRTADGWRIKTRNLFPPHHGPRSPRPVQTTVG